MLFYPSFTQSERLLHTDQLITRRDKLQSCVDEKRVRERVQVRCSDLVGSDLPHKTTTSASDLARLLEWRISQTCFSSSGHPLTALRTSG